MAAVLLSDVLGHFNYDTQILNQVYSLSSEFNADYFQVRDNVLVYNELVERTGAFPQRRNYAKGESMHEEIYLNPRDVDRLVRFF